MVTVMNLATGDKLHFTCAPKDAVVSAYAQSIKDGATWLYAKYAERVIESPLTYLLGDFSAFKDGREF